MDFNEYSKKLRRVNDKREIKITNSYNIYNSWNHYRGARPKEKKYALSYKKYSDFIYKVNKRTADEMLTGNIIKLFDHCGSINIKRFNQPKIKITDEGKIKTNRRINWKETLTLWHEDKECELNKTLVYHEDNLYKFIYKNVSHYVTNSEYYMLLFNRTIKHALLKRIKDENIYFPLEINYKNGS